MGILLLLLALAPLAAQGPKVPENDGWVTDRAGLLGAGQEAALEALMESYKQGSGHEVALLTVPSLEGRPIEELGLAVGRAWKIGREGQNDGALLLVARDDREMRIEVGRGLEGNLTDSICGRIIRDVIAPRFKAGRFYDGIREGIEAIHAAAGGDYGRIPRRRGEGPGSLLGVFVLLFLVLPIVFGSRRRRGHGIEPFLWGAMMGSSWGGGRGGGHGGGFGGGGFGGFGGGGGFSGGGASGGW